VPVPLVAAAMLVCSHVGSHRAGYKTVLLVCNSWPSILWTVRVQLAMCISNGYPAFKLAMCISNGYPAFKLAMCISNGYPAFKLAMCISYGYPAFKPPSIHTTNNRHPSVCLANYLGITQQVPTDNGSKSNATTIRLHELKIFNKAMDKPFLAKVSPNLNFTVHLTSPSINNTSTGYILDKSS